MLSNVKRPRPTALFPSFVAQAGQVALAPNPALPTDQPLRGSQLNADVVLLQTRINHFNRCSVDGSIQMLFYSKLALITPITTRQMAQCRCCFYSKLASITLAATRQMAQCRCCFTPNSHQSCQSLRGRWLNADAVFTPNSHQSLQLLRGRWRKKCCLRLVLA